jgi:hypothetical protein
VSPSRLSVTLVVLVVCTAGCGGVVSDAGTSTPEPPDAPPGVEASGVTDPTALTSAHGSVLSNRSYATTQTTTVTFDNGTVYAERVRNATVASGDHYLLASQERGSRTPVGYGARVAFYADDETTQQLVVSWNGTRDVRREPVGFVGQDNPFDGLPRQRDLGRENIVYQLLASAETQTVELQPADGRYRIAVDGATPTALPFVADAGPANATLHVTPDGVVTDLVVSYLATVGGEPVRVRTVVRYDKVGTATVERPDWVGTG